jgi:hypothetical protein
MNTQNAITLPKKRQTRTVIFGIRLTPDEREQITSFARQINFPAHAPVGADVPRRGVTPLLALSVQRRLSAG